MKSISLLIAIMIFTNVAFTSYVEQKLKVKLEIPISSSDLADTSKEVELTLAIQIDEPNASSSPDASNQGNNGANGVPSPTNPNEVVPAKSTNININVPIDQTASSSNENSSKSTISFTDSQKENFKDCVVEYTKISLHWDSNSSISYSNTLLSQYENGSRIFGANDYTKCEHFLTETTGSP